MRGKTGLESAPEWKRIQMVMAVTHGLVTVTEACRSLGISRNHYYRLEERFLASAIEWMKPRKPGPKVVPEDPKLLELEEKLRQSQRERELLELKVKDLESVNEAVRTQVLGEGRGKKQGRKRRPLAPGPAVPGKIPAADAGVRKDSAGGGKTGG
jgi:transposase-like protein